MKRMLAFLFAVIMALSLVACGENENEKKSQKEKDVLQSYSNLIEQYLP